MSNTQLNQRGNINSGQHSFLSQKRKTYKDVYYLSCMDLEANLQDNEAQPILFRGRISKLITY